jgi:hypothetical protein
MRRLLPALLISAAVITSFTSGGSDTQRPSPTIAPPSTSTSTTEQEGATEPASNADWDAAAAKLPAAPRTIDVYTMRDTGRDTPQAGKHQVQVHVDSRCIGAGWQAVATGPNLEFEVAGPEDIIEVDFASPLAPHGPCNILERVGAILNVTEKSESSLGTRLIGTPDPDKLETAWAAAPEVTGNADVARIYAKSFTTVELLLDAQGVPVQLELRGIRPAGDPATAVLVFNEDRSSSAS